VRKKGYIYIYIERERESKAICLLELAHFA